MEIRKTIWKASKKVLRWFDFSGESFSFKYRDQDKLSTVSAGIIYIVYFIFVFVYFIKLFMQIKDHEIFDLKYYTMKANKDERLILSNIDTSFAFGLTNDNKNAEYDITDLFDLTVEYVEKVRSKKETNGTNETNEINETNKTNGTNETNKTNGTNETNNANSQLDYTICTKTDFIHTEEVEILWDKIEKMNCLNKSDLAKSPRGIFTDSIFSYYSITVKSKYKNNETHDKIIDEYLTRDDCKFQFYYTDIRLDLDNYTEPFSYIINSIFLQLNPTLIQKKNIYYMNYYLDNDTSPIKFFVNQMNTIKKTGLSRVEDYSLYKGINRTFEEYEDIDEYAKIYIRADNSQIIIKRTYQDYLEFYADRSSLWLSIYWILGFLFSLYDRENANHSISKKLFYFEGIKDNKFNKFKELKEIKELINKIEKNQKNEPNDKVHVSPYTTRNSATSKTLNNNFTRKNSKASLSTDLEKIQKEQNKLEKLVNYDNYNLLEMIGSQKLFFCKSKSFESKVNLFNQAKNIIDDKLDVIYYIRKMILFEIINEIQLENKNIINFLSRPVIYLNGPKNIKKKHKNELNDKATNFSIEIQDIGEIDDIEQKKIEEKMNMDPIEILKEYVEDETYRTAYKLNPVILTKKIGKLLQKQDKTDTETKLISYLKKQLKGIH